MTNDVPYAHLKTDPAVVSEIVAGGRPKQPIILSYQPSWKRVWDVCMDCWREDVRPSMVAILDALVSPIPLFMIVIEIRIA